MVLGAELLKNPMLNSLQKESLHIQDSSSLKNGMEAKSGKLKLHLPGDQANHPQHIVLKLYAAVPCPFAVVFPDKYICPKHCGLVQLKNFSVEAVDETDFTIVISDMMEGGKYLRFTVESSEERESWVNAFRNVKASILSNSCKRKSKQNSSNIRLPSLEEVSEEVEIEEERTILKSCENVLSDNVNRRSPLTPRRRVLEVPALEQISEEEGEDLESDEDDFESRAMSNSRRRSSLKERLSEVSSRGGRSL